MRTLGLMLLCLALTACAVSPSSSPPDIPPPPAPEARTVPPQGAPEKPALQPQKPPGKPPLPPPGPRQVRLGAQGDGWVLEATPESRVGNDVLGSPLGLWWTAPDRALVQWVWPDMTSEFHMVDLAAGTMRRVDFDQVRSVSPDGRYVTDHLRGGAGTLLKEAETGREVWRAPGWVSGEAWLSPSLLHLWLESRSLVYDVQSGEAVAFPVSFRPVPLRTEACYRTQVNQQVACTTLDGRQTKLLTPEKPNPDVHHLPDGFAADLAGRRLAFLYAAPRVSWWRPAPGHAWWEPATAHAMQPVVYSWVDTLGVYDGETGAIARHRLPRPGIPTAPVWSPDGARVAFGLRQMEGQGLSVRPKGQTEFFLLEVAGGKLTRVGAASSRFNIPRILHVFGDGRLALHLAHDEEPLVMARDGRLERWRPGLEMLIGSETLAFQGEGNLEVYLPDGLVRTWTWQGGSEHGRVSVEPQVTEWAAVQSHDPGRVVFLKR